MDDRIIDLRSDTVTRPTAAMRAAMAAAEVGDDVLDGDPTTIRLQERVAALVGQQAALLVPSGTMGNLLATLTHTRPGDELIVERRNHVVEFEGNGVTALAGVLPLPLDGHRGHLTAAQVGALLGELIPRGPRPTLLWLENTANLAGGTVQTVAETRALSELARQQRLAVHLDGARLWHAAAATGVAPAAYGALCDSVMCCLSKGLCCPVGSLLCGSREFVAAAHELRRRVGGGMRQSGVLAAAGLVALEQQLERLPEDHHRARRLAAALAELPGLTVELESVETNIVWFHCADPSWPRRCAEAGVRFVAMGAGRCRAVTHAEIDEASLHEALRRLRGLPVNG
ncbi:MAG: hypothetical protein IT204_19265 [Fimbriimonadaceae bacterium]|nr:hypothetical protein [Fimbriimonadaceae bacterium]